MSVILKTQRQLNKVLQEQYIDLYLKYIHKFINTNLFNINNNDTNELLNDHTLLYRKNLIYIDYDLINSLMPNEYIYQLPNFSFVMQMINICKLPIYLHIKNEINNKLILFYKLKATSIKTKTNYKVIKNKKELINIEDEIKDKYKILEPEFDPNGLTLLYINGSLLKDTCLHEDLLERYCINYSSYEQESEKKLTNLLNKISILSWEDLNKYNISAARLYSYSYNISELLIKYGDEDLFTLSKKIFNKLNQKIYTFLSDSNLTMRVAAKINNLVLK